MFGSSDISICDAFKSAKSSAETNSDKDSASVLKLLTKPGHQCKGNPIYKSINPGTI